MVKVKGTPRQRWVRKSILTIEAKPGLMQELTQEEVAYLVKHHEAAMEARLLKGWIDGDPKKRTRASVSHVLVGLDVEGLELMATVETAETSMGYKLSRYLSKYGDNGLVLEGKFWRLGEVGKRWALVEVNIKAEHMRLYTKVETHHKRVKRNQKGRRHGEKVR